MTRCSRDSSDASPECFEPDCANDAAFFVYDTEDWRSICERHARRHHPSLEVHAWLVSGYMKPVESGKPDGMPSEPRTEREAAFRAEVREVLDWDERRD